MQVKWKLFSERDSLNSYETFKKGFQLKKKELSCKNLSAFCKNIPIWKQAVLGSKQSEVWNIFEKLVLL